MNLLQWGHQSPAYRLVVDRLFNEGQAEYAVGMFLADNPKPSSAQIEQFQCSLSDEIMDDVESVGWDRLVYTIDRQILDAVRDPQSRAEVERALAMEPTAVLAEIDSVRRVIFCRTANFIERRSLAG